MTNDKQILKELHESEVSRDKIGNRKHTAIKDKGTIAMKSYTGTKLMTDVFFVFEIDHNFLSMGQLLEKGYKVIFENKKCLIKDANDHGMFKIKMRGKSFLLDLMENKQVASLSSVNNIEL